MRELEAMADQRSGVTAAHGFAASGVAAGIKPGSEKKDCALVFSDRPASAAGVFTTNVVRAPGVEWCAQVCKRGRARGVFINSGNANACTGDGGRADVVATAERVAALTETSPEEICVCSTGVIGVRLPMDKVLDGAARCVEALAPSGGIDAATAIMTTDVVRKEFAVELPLGAGTVRIGGMSKGAGMIAPNMATTIAVVTTDATVAPAHLEAALRRAVDVSFNAVCVDNDMSTSDTLLVLANGAAGLPALTPDSEDFRAFEAGLQAVCTHLAQALVRDGEGVTKFVEIQVEGAPTDADARTIARAVAKSDLVKTAFYGEDPNWGRIACAAGYSGVTFDPNDLAIWLGPVKVLERGEPTDYEEDDAAAVMKRPEYVVRIAVGNGPGRTVFWTSDLTLEYIRINADYRS